MKQSNQIVYIYIYKQGAGAIQLSWLSAWTTSMGAKAQGPESTTRKPGMV